MEHKKIAEGVLEAVGGKENVRSATHCMTRLRLVLKDEGKSSDEKIKAVQGVIQVVHAGDQVQIIIGPGVDMVYDEFCAVSGLEKAAVIEENLDAPKEKLTIKTVLNNMMGALSGCITPALPVFMVAGIFKMIAVLLGPSNVGLIPEGSDLLTLCNLVSDAGYYFLPFIIAYSSAKKFNCSPVLAMTLVSVALHPTMMEIVAAGEGFSIYGIPMVLVNYRQAVIPVIIMIWAMSKVEKLVKKIVPAILRTLGVPVLTIAIMLPIGYCLCGPICNVVMGWVANLIIWMTNTIGIFAIVVVAATWSLCIVFGMHIPVMMTLLPVWMEMGYDAIVSPAACAGLFAGLGIQLAYALRANGQENRALGWSCFVTNFTANVSEPYVYGIYLRDRHAFAWHTLGAMAGAGVMGLIGAKITMFTGVGFPILNVLRFGEYAVQGAIGCTVAFVVAIVLGFIFGFDKTEEKA